MSKLQTKYGVIEEYDNLEMHDAETPASVLIKSPMTMETSCGPVIPLHQVEDQGRQLHRPVLFYPNGNVRRAPLQEAVQVDTQCGTFSAELLLFYKDGSLKKLFPLAGKLSGYWSEENEYTLAADSAIQLSTGDIKAKIINMGFYASGAARSITFWPDERVTIQSPLGEIETRMGIAFYETGAIKNLEPAAPTSVETPIGTLKAFDNDPEGINGDVNSLRFDAEGNLTAISTISERITVTTESNKQTYAPTEKASLCSELVKVTTPLLIEFFEGKVRFNKSHSDEYDIATCAFNIEDHVADTVIPSYDC